MQRKLSRQFGQFLVLQTSTATCCFARLFLAFSCRT
ncbi:hypothetical protein EG68_02353 [Paragonimus skrjabini miyazakii]|uniref:Uncharacterized protein n=1 Tax=Paragonimus skrjabini miyazakii TaxID=59628 RepID=A0A8S9Z3E2_9TREM|nr:hypothetical protein EG68_02353 [Paragonimus skrjabini miyazakii]